MVLNDSINKFDLWGLFVISTGMEIPPACCDERIWFEDIGSIRNPAAENVKYLGTEATFIPPRGVGFWENYWRNMSLTRSTIFKVWFELDLTADVVLACKKQKRDCSIEKQELAFNGIHVPDIKAGLPLQKTWGDSIPNPAAAVLSKVQTARLVARLVTNSPEIKEALKAAMGGEEALDTLCKQVFQK